jgi:hypothetical protein
MRTTVTLDPDTEILLREEMRRSGLSSKEALNQSIRRALLGADSGAARYVVTPIFPAAFPAEFSSGSLNRLADELDDDASRRG